MAPKFKYQKGDKVYSLRVEGFTRRKFSFKEFVVDMRGVNLKTREPWYTSGFNMKPWPESELLTESEVVTKFAELLQENHENTQV